jgi:hypothetical protein
MKTKWLRQNNGSALISAAVAASVLAILVAGFVAYLSNEYLLNYHTHAWTQSVHLAEAAVEKGFAEYNYQYFRGSSGFESSRGWSGSNGTYTTSITLTNSLNRLVGTGSVTVYGVGSINPSIQGIGTAVVSRGPATVSRGVKIGLAKSKKFPVGVMTKNKMDLKGSNFYSDSYDSKDASKSTSGKYDAAKRQANGNIATDATIIDSINMAAPTIYGTVSTGPNGTVTMGNGASVGATFDPSLRAYNVADGISDGWIRNDFATDIPDASLPQNFSSAGNLGTLKNTGTLAIQGGDWTIDSMDLKTGSNIIISNGTIRLYITGDVNISGQGSIVVADGAKLELYAAGNVNIAGQGVINLTGDPANNQFYGLPTSTSWSISGNGVWLGTVYAPEADVQLSGGGSSGDMSGAIVANTITLSGGTKFHYDEDLANLIGFSGYTVASWQELRYSGGSWVP